MKALEILEYKLRDYISNEVHKNCEYYIYSSLMDMVDEAIAELEALQEENEHLKRIVEAFKKENK